MSEFPTSDRSANGLSLSSGRPFPIRAVDARFVERLAGELKALGVQLDDDLYFICRSGSRSLAAAKAMAEAGYRSCHNVSGGFEGPLDDLRHRGTLQWMESVRSSLAARLVGKPWRKDGHDCPRRSC